jgi:hypothetical protein
MISDCLNRRRRCGAGVAGRAGPPEMGTGAMRTQRRHPTGSSRIMGLVFHRIERNHLHHCLRKATIPTGASRRPQFPALSFIGEEIPHPWRIFPIATAGRRLSVRRGSLVKAERKNGPDVWQFRWSEKGGDRRRVYRKPGDRNNRAIFRCCWGSANRARIIAKPSSLDSRSAPQMMVAELCEHFQHRELAHNDVWRSYSMKRTHFFYLNKWIIPRWKDYELVAARTWKWRRGYAVRLWPEAHAPRFET